MPNQMQAKLRQVKTVSALFRVICTGLLLFVALLGVAAAICVAFGVGGVNFNGGVFSTAGMALSRRFVLGLITVVAWAALIKCLEHLRRLFRIYSRGEIFAREAVHQLRQFGIACLLWGVLSFLWRLSLASLAHPIHAARTVGAPGQSLAIGIFVVVIAWFMDMAVDLREENELTI